MGQWIRLAAAAVAVATGLAARAEALTEQLLPERPASLPGAASERPDPRVRPHLWPAPAVASAEVEGALALSNAQRGRRATAYGPLRAWATPGQLHLAIRFSDRFALMPTYRSPSLGSGPEHQHAHRFMVTASWRF